MKGVGDDSIFRIICFLIGIVGRFGSFNFTVIYLLASAPMPVFSGNWWINPNTLRFVATVILAFMISAAQDLTLVLYEKMIIPLMKAFALTVFAIASVVSVLITINTFANAIEQNAVNAKNNSDVYLQLLEDKKRVAKALNQERRMKQERFDSNYRAAAAEEFNVQIERLEWRERMIDEKLSAFDEKHSDIISQKTTYRTISRDICFLFGMNTNKWVETLSLSLTYLMLLSTAVIIDVFSSLLVAYSIIGNSSRNKAEEEVSPGIVHVLSKKWFGFTTNGNEESNAQQYSKEKPIIMREKMSAHEIKAALPFATCILDAVRFITTRILFVGCSGGGKTTTIMELIKRYGPKDAVYFFMDPKNDHYNIPPGIDIQIIGQGEKAMPVRDKLVDIMNLFSARSAMTDTEVAKQQDVIVAIDEGIRWKRLFKRDLDDDFGDYVIPMLDYGRRNKIHIWLISKSDRAGEIGLEGAYDKIKNFAYKIHQEYDESSDTRWCELHRKRMPPELFQPPKLGIRSTAATGTIIEAGKALMRKFGGVIGNIKSDHPLDHSNHKFGDESKFSDGIMVTQNSSDLESDRHFNKSDQIENTASYTDNSDRADHSNGVSKVIGDHSKYAPNTSEKTLADNSAITPSPDITPPKNENDTQKNSESDLSDAAKKIQFTPEDKHKLLSALFELGDKATPTGAVRIGLGGGRKGGPTVEAAKNFFIEVGCWPLNTNDNGDGKKRPAHS